MLLIKALFLCVTKHWRQKDKAGKRYIWHPITVMLNVKGYNEKVTALLHDIIEDTEVTINNLKTMKFGPEIIEAVDIITKKNGQEYFKYLKSVKNNEIARKVKIADLRHNKDLNRLKYPDKKDYKRVEKYRKALEMLNN